MRASYHSWGGVTSTVYYMDRGENVARHQHPGEHTTAVIAGHTEVSIWGRPGGHCTMLVKMSPDDPGIILPANLDHEVRAMADGTIVIHMGAGMPKPQQQAAPGGVMMHDGTVAHADT